MPRKVWILFIGMFINVTAISFIWPLNTIFINGHLGKPLWIAGLVLTFNSLASVIGSMLGGYLFDKMGSYRTIVIGISISVVGAIILAIDHGWYAYVPALLITGFGSGMVFPAIYALAGKVWPEGGTKTFSAIYVAQNAGMAVGAALGGYIASYSFDYIFIGNAVVYVVFTVFVIATFRGMANDSERKPSKAKSEERGWRKVSPSMRALLFLCIAYIFCWFGYTQWQATISVHMERLGIDLKMYSLLWTINGLCIVCLQPLITIILPKIFKSINRQMVAGMFIFCLSFLLLIGAKGFNMFLISMIVITLGEMLVWPAIPTVANRLAPPDKVGFFQGVVNSAGTVGKMVGPLIGGLIVDLSDINLLFIVIVALIGVGMVITSVYDRGLPKELQTDPEYAS
ncbi:MFS transporter [Paenibacillus sp. N1-5-1-14]|uniref:MDR family MFS transporter n=1 Tax=Paenibacillus radicibacter TaxID=2972488 RepID=UPI002159A634|nr:MFS transporter [Paenibacillus radicibacter]MCR8641100.1 MFS transporter [Paenibacillus radicibacter]